MTAQAGKLAWRGWIPMSRPGSAECASCPTSQLPARVPRNGVTTAGHRLTRKARSVMPHRSSSPNPALYQSGDQDIRCYQNHRHRRKSQRQRRLVLNQRACLMTFHIPGVARLELAIGSNKMVSNDGRSPGRDKPKEVRGSIHKRTDITSPTRVPPPPDMKPAHPPATAHLPAKNQASPSH